MQCSAVYCSTVYYTTVYCSPVHCGTVYNSTVQCSTAQYSAGKGCSITGGSDEKEEMSDCLPGEDLLVDPLGHPANVQMDKLEQQQEKKGE